MYHNIKHETSDVPSFMSYLSSISTIPSISSIPSASTTNDVADKENFYTTTNDDSLSLRETCKECKKSFKCPIRFRHLAKNSHNHEWICLVCCQTYKSRRARDFPCVLCDKKCYESVGLRHHFNAKHRGKEFPSILLRIPVTATIPCDHCSAVFFEKGYQRKHMNKEHHREVFYPHTCPHCQTRFRKKRLLKHHCNVCKYQTDATSQSASQSTSQSTLQSTLDDEQSKVKNDFRYQMYNKHPMITRSKRKYSAFVYLKKYGSLDDEKYRKKKLKNDVKDGGDSNMSRIKREDDGDSNMSRIKRENDGDSDMSRIKREDNDDSDMSGIKRESDNNPDYMQRIKYEDDRGSSYLPRIKQEYNNYYMSNIKREDTYMPIIKHER